MSIVKTSDISAFTKAGDIINYTYVVTSSTSLEDRPFGGWHIIRKHMVRNERCNREPIEPDQIDVGFIGKDGVPHARPV
jgi:hypothetical protein